MASKAFQLYCPSPSHQSCGRFLTDQTLLKSRTPASAISRIPLTQPDAA